MKKFLKSLLIPLVSFAIAAAVFPAGTSLLDSQTVLADTTADTSIKNGLFHEGTDWNCKRRNCHRHNDTCEI